MNNKILNVENLSFKYGSVRVLNSINFSINAGDYLGIIGPNGSGKTTLIKILLKLLKPEKGKVEYFNNIIKDNALGYVPQKTFNSQKNFPATVKEIVRTGLLANKEKMKFYTKEDNKEVESILRRLKIADLKNNKIGELSGGQQQRVLLARSLISKPKLLILDEPTSALDPKIREDFYHLLKEINNTGVSIILISHDLSAVEKDINKVLLLDRKVLFFGKLASFKKTMAFDHYTSHKHQLVGEVNE